MPAIPRWRVTALLLNTLVLALLGGSALFAILGRGPEWLSPRSQPGEVPGAPAIHSELTGAVGVNFDAAELGAPDLPERLARLATGGIHWLRFRIPWDQVEAQQGQFEWAAWDRVFAALAIQPGLQPVVVLDGSPAWARPASDATNALAPPQTRAHFGAFAAAVARRYGSQIRYYQVWDEPNIAPHWGARPVDPAGYTGLLREAALQIRALDPDAKIVLAALAPNIEAGGANQSDVAYLDALYGLGARAWFDIAAGQPYGFSQSPDAQADQRTLNFSRAALLYDVMVRHSDAASPLWATAFGWNALPDKWQGRGSPWGQVSETQQAQYATAALALARTRWPWLGPLFWAADCPPFTGRAADDPRLGFATCDQEGAARPVWTALTTAAAKAGPVLPPGTHQTNHPALHYGPGWRVTPGAADPSANGDTLTFTFYGTQLGLRVQGGPFWAYYKVSVDGLPANALPRDESGAAYLVLNDPLAETRTVVVARGLPPAQHNASIEATGGWDQWALQGVVVSVAAAPAVPVGVWLVLAVVAAASWAWLAWPWRPRAAAWLAAGQAWVEGWPEPVAWGVAGVLGLGYLLSPRAALDLPLLLLLGVVCLLRPALLLPFIAAAIPFWPSPKPVLRWQFSAYELLIWLGTAIILARWLLNGRQAGAAVSRAFQPPRAPGAAARVRSVAGAAGRRLGLRGLDYPVLALLAVALASTAAASRPDVAWREFRTVFLAAGLFYFLVTRVLAGAVCGSTRPEGKTGGSGARSLALVPAILPVMDGLLLGVALVSLLALWQLVSGQGRIDVEGVWRVRALYGSPNNLALVLDRTVPIALAVAFFGRTSRPRRWLYGLSAPVMALACIATFSKGALLLGLPGGIILVVIGGAWRTRRRWPLVLLVAGSAVVALALALLFQTQRFADLTNFETGTSFIRIRLWQSAWRMALDHPLLGVGPDNFLYAYRTRYVLPSAWEELNLSHPHNILLDLWTRLGILGLVTCGWALIAAFTRAWRVFRAAEGPAWPVALGLLGALAATVLHGLIDNSLFLIDLMAIFMLTLALLQVMSENQDAGPDTRALGAAVTDGPATA